MPAFFRRIITILVSFFWLTGVLMRPMVRLEMTKILIETQTSVLPKNLFLYFHNLQLGFSRFIQLTLLQTITTEMDCPMHWRIELFTGWLRPCGELSYIQIGRDRWPFLESETRERQETESHDCNGKTAFVPRDWIFTRWNRS